MIEIQATTEDLGTVVTAIKERLGEGGVVILQGNLAAGKTTLTQHFAQSLGVSEAVTSPTFSLQQCYGEQMYHYDIYNHGLDHFLSLGMLEELEKEGYHFIEWGDETLYTLLKSAMIPVIVVEIQTVETDNRVYRITDA